MDWISENKEWLFSGAGGLIVVTVIGIIFRSRTSTQKINGGKNSINIQAGQNINLNNLGEDEHVQTNIKERK